jgi:hypothetical protein
MKRSLWVLAFLCLDGMAAPAAPGVPLTLTRDAIEYENRMHFFTLAASAAKVEKIKREAALIKAQSDYNRAAKLARSSAVTETEYRERKLDFIAAKFEVEEQDHIIAELTLDAEMTDLYRRWENGEKEDLKLVADYYLRRWENLLLLTRIQKRKAEARQDFATWHLIVAKKLNSKGAMTAQEVDSAELSASLAKSAIDLATEKITEAEEAIEDAKKTLDRAKKQS